MIIVIEIFEYVLAGILGFLLGYQTLLSFAALKGSSKTGFKASKNRKFAIVIPTHNEEKLLSKSLYSMSGFVYPKNMYDLIVLAYNCNDNSTVVGRNLGATVLELEDPENKGKDYALSWAFDQILQSPANYDAIVVLNPNSLVSGNFLEVINSYMDNGSKVIQSSNLLLPEPGIWSNELPRIGFLLNNYVKPFGRKVLGLDTGLQGNGICFSTDYFLDTSISTNELFGKEKYGILLKGVNVDFAPEARVCSEFPDKSQLQRTDFKWYSVTQKYSLKLLESSIRKRSLTYFDRFLDLVTPTLSNIMFFVLLIYSINIIIWQLGWIPVIHMFIWSVVVFFGLLYLCIGLYIVEADRQLLKSLFYIPVYLAWKIKFYLKSKGENNNNLFWARIGERK